MIDRVEAAPGVLALRVRGHVAREDIERCHDLLAEAFENHPKVSLLVEAEALSGFDTEAITLAFDRGTKLLRSLDRFGRVAIVSDHAWIRWLSRIESAVLPGLSYRVYRAAERRQALAWVEGRTDLPYGNAVRLVMTSRADAVAIEIDGRLATEEVSRIAHELNEHRLQGPLRAVLVVVRRLDGVDPGVFLDGAYLRLKLELPAELDRYAVVGGPAWLAGWLRFWQPLVRAELRRFEIGEEDAAWAWIGAHPLAPGDTTE